MNSFLDNFLLSMPALNNNEYFAESTSYICDYSREKGTMAFVLDKPLFFTLEDLFKQLNLPSDSCLYKDTNLLRGGPVYPENGFILHKGEPSWQSSFKVKEGIAITTSLDILAAIAKNEFTDKFLVFMGCSMWEAGQLENELSLNAWVTYPAQEEILFDTAQDEIRQKVADLLGLDLNAILPWTTYV